MPTLTYKTAGTTKYGNHFWETRDGMFRLYCSDRIEDIALPRLWIVWRWHRGGWVRNLETRSRRRAEKQIRKLAAMLEDE